MFRGFNLKDSNVDNVKFTLMKNINEPYAEIPKSYIKNINVKFQDCNTLTMEIPNKIFERGISQDEKLYNLVLGRQQQIIVDNSGVKERYIITQCERTEEVYKGDNGKNVVYKVKKIECKSYEYTLIDKQMITDEDLYRQLYYDPTITTGAIDVSEGYLNMLEDDTDFSVEVTELARKEFGKAYNEYYIDIADSNILNMAKGTTIWESDVAINPIGANAVNLKVSYTSIKSYDSSNKLLIDSKKIHDTNLSKLYTGVKHIKAVYDGNDDYRYGIHYVITMSDDVVIDRWEDLGLFLDNQRIVFDGIVLAYADGSEGEISTIKHRSISTGTYSYLSLLRDTISEAFDVIVTFDTYNMKVSVCDRTEIGENKGVEFSYSNFIQSINKKEQYDEICNKLNVSSSNTSIVDVNPFGTSYILDYSYHYDNGLMSEELMSSWDRYLANIENSQADLYDLRLSKNTLNKKQIKDEAERTELDLAIRDLGVRRVDYIKNNTNGQFASELSNITTQINTKQARYGVLMVSIQSSKDSIATIDEQIKTILKDISLEGATDTIGLIFTSSLIKELNSITIEDTLEENDFYTVSLGLYNYAKGKLTDRNKLGIEFDINVTGLLQNIIIPKGVSWNYYINVGDFVTLDNNEIVPEDERGLRIIEFDYNPNEFNISKITFSNKDKKDEELKSASNVGKSVSKSNSYINNYKTTWQNSISANDYIDSMLYGDGMDLKSSVIRSRSQRVKMDMTECGTYYIDAYNEDNQMFISSSMICVTNDRFLTVKTCLDENGVAGKFILGELIIGKQLYITSDLNEFYIGNINPSTKNADSNGTSFGLQIKENEVERIFLGIEKDSDGIRRAKLRLTTKDGLRTTLTEEGSLQPLQLIGHDELDSTHPMSFKFYLDQGINRVDYMSLRISSARFRSNTKGASSGGGSTSSSGGGGTSSAGGYYSDNIASTSESAMDYFVTESGYYYEKTQPDGKPSHVHLVGESDAFKHTHDVSIPITIQSHYHTTDVHTHDTYNHSHDNIFGITEDSLPSNMSISCNGTQIATGVNGSDYEISIKNHIIIGQWNEITITSGSNGRVNWNLIGKSFNLF